MKPYRYKRSKASQAYFEADSLDELARHVIGAERESEFRERIFNPKGVLSLPAGAQGSGLASAFADMVNGARQRHEAFAGTRDGRWAFAPNRADGYVVFAPTAPELAEKVALRYVDARAINPSALDARMASDDIFNGSLYHEGRKIEFDEPLVDGGRRSFEDATGWFAAVERAVTRCALSEEQLREVMRENARAIVRHLVTHKDVAGILLGVERNAKDERGEKRDLVAIVDDGASVRRLGLAAPTSDLVTRRIENVGALVGKEIEFAETPSGFVADEVPDFARGLSEAALRREYEGMAAGR